MNNENYIKCDVFISNLTNKYCFVYGGAEYPLSEAMNIPGFEGYLQEDNKEREDWFMFLSNVDGAPIEVQFCVPIVDKKAWPKCEGCNLKQGKYCDKTAHITGKVNDNIACVYIRECIYERGEYGKCGGQGKFFIPKKKAEKGGT